MLNHYATPAIRQQTVRDLRKGLREWSPQAKITVMIDGIERPVGTIILTESARGGGRRMRLELQPRKRRR